MLAKTKLLKLEKQLDKVQARCRERLLTMDEIKTAIEQAETEIKSVRAELRPKVIFQYNPHYVAKSYDYRAEGTALTVRFSKSGKAISANVERDRVSHIDNTTCRLSLMWSSLYSFIKDELGVERPDYEDRDATRKFDKLALIVAKESGFNQHLTRPL